MDKIYLIIHAYDVDGGFGDPVEVEEIIGSFTDGPKAHQYVEEHSKPLIYDKPYGCLYFGELRVKEVLFNTVTPVDERRFIGDWNRDDVSRWNNGLV